MALPVDFWRNEQSLNIFRTKPCQRLLKDGVCDWRSQCQFSHCIGWPRRAPSRHKYSPEICPHIQKIRNQWSGAEQIKNSCTNFHCQWSHSQEEVLFHPRFFKTILCDEYDKSLNNSEKRRGGAKRGKCHRYYCPFAHGSQELRVSDITPEEQEKCLRSLDVFPSDKCCKACALPRALPLSMLAPPRTLASALEPESNIPAFKQSTSPASWPPFPMPLGASPWPQGALFQKQLQPQPGSALLPSSAFSHSPFPAFEGKTSAVAGKGGTSNQNVVPSAEAKDFDEDAWDLMAAPAFVNINGVGTGAATRDLWSLARPTQVREVGVAPPEPVELPKPQWMRNSNFGDTLESVPECALQIVQQELAKHQWASLFGQEGEIAFNADASALAEGMQEPMKPKRSEDAALTDVFYAML